MRIWAKIVFDEKIVKDTIYEGEKGEEFFDAISNICYSFDIETPIILQSHIDNFDNFNLTKFKQQDFIDTFEYDALVLENAEL